MFHNYVAVVATDIGDAALLPQIFIPVFITRRALPRALSQSRLSNVPGLVDNILLNTFVTA